MSVSAYEGKRELRWLRIGAVVVTYIEAGVSISDELWNRWLTVIGNPGTAAVLLCAWGPSAPSTGQWRRATNLIKDTGVPVAVVTEDRHNAALAKKAAWVGAKIQSFRWGDSLYEPCAFLGLDLDTRKRLEPQVFVLRDYHGPVGDGAAQPQAQTQRRAAPLTSPSTATEGRQMPAWMRDGDDYRPSREPLAERPGRSAGSMGSMGSVGKSSSKNEVGLAADFQRSRDAVFKSSSDIQAKLAEVQARLRARNGR